MMAVQTLIAPAQPAVLTAVVNTWPAQGEWNYEHLRKLPDDGRRYEIIRGTLYMVSAPSYPHQVTVGEVYFHLQRFVAEHELGVVACAPCEVCLSESAQLVQPDVIFVRDAQSLANQKVFAGAPALVVEVLSPNAERRDRVVKFDVYEAAGVEEYWLADLKTCSVEVYTLSRGEYALLGKFSGDEHIRSNVLPGLTIRTKLLFNL
jgi:Uma2 family endonuclease